VRFFDKYWTKEEKIQNIHRNIAMNMGATKTELFSQTQNAMATYAKAIGHPARVAILEFLAKTDKCICGDIVDELPLAQPTVSQHLRELKEAGLIKGAIEGAAICYCIDKENLMRLQRLLAELVEQIGVKESRCC
jgi:ArsR family transcriptional regulator, arsenate/arsenite/antimonite-responsive transcriptional repressor